MSEEAGDDAATQALRAGMAAQPLLDGTGKASEATVAQVTRSLPLSPPLSLSLPLSDSL